MSILKPYIDAGRELALVGHDTQQDIKYLASLGVDIPDLKCIKRVLDIQSLHQSWRDLDNGSGLRTVLNDLGIQHRYLHNAGNDANYTLKALMGIVHESVRKQEAVKNGREYELLGWATTV